jgi:hypothetical protein
VSSSDPNPVLSVQPAAGSGRFKFTNVMPGHYTITARADRNQSGPAADYLYGVAEIDVRGEDIDGISLNLQPGSTFGGHVVFDGTSLAIPADLTAIKVSVTLPAGSFFMRVGGAGGAVIGNAFSSVAPASVTASGTFSAANIAPGTYRLAASLPPAASGWSLRSAVSGGRDFLDAPLEFKPGLSLTDVVLTFSDKHTELSGSLRTAGGQPASDYFVIVFPAASDLWLPGSRRVTSVRPASDGTFVVRSLPGGEYYIAALEDVEAADLADAHFLGQVVPAAVKVTLVDGERKIQDLVLAR